MQFWVVERSCGARREEDGRGGGGDEDAGKEWQNDESGGQIQPPQKKKKRGMHFAWVDMSKMVISAPPTETAIPRGQTQQRIYTHLPPRSTMLVVRIVLHDPFVNLPHLQGWGKSKSGVSKKGKKEKKIGLKIM